MSSKDEKALLKDIDALKKALPDLKKLSSFEPELTKIKEQKKVISSALDKVKGLINDKETIIQDVKAKSQVERDKQSEVREGAEKYTAHIDTDNEKIRETYQKKDQMRESYFKQLYEWELQNDECRWIRGQMNVQKRIN